MTLPLGVECDKCNQRHGRLESALLLHNRIWPILMLRSVPGKGGKPRGQLGDIERDPATGALRFRQAGRVERTPDGLHFTFPDPKGFDLNKCRRALFHIGLNHLALIEGGQRALEAKYDGVREYVMGGGDPSRWRYAQFMHDDNAYRTDMGLSLLRDAPSTIIQLRLFIDDFYIDLEGRGMLGDWARDNLPLGTGII